MMVGLSSIRPRCWKRARRYRASARGWLARSFSDLINDYASCSFADLPCAPG